MSTNTNINAVISQGAAVSKVHNVSRQDMVLHQQLISKSAEDKKTKEKIKVPKSDAKNKIEDKDKKEKEKQKKIGDKQKESKKQEIEDEMDLSEGSIIDITV